MLSGRSAVVTGGLSGIGRAIAVALATDGARVGVLDISVGQSDADEAFAAAMWEVGHEPVTARGDVADAASVGTALEALARINGEPDILISNAGLIANFGTLETLSLEGWNLELGVNLSGAFHVCRALVPGMAARGWGRVVFLSSCAAWTGSPVQAGYGPTKAGLLGLSNTIARAYGPRGVTANAILPGFVSTPLVNAHFPRDERARVEASVPIRRFVAPEEVAALATFLASPAAAAINGTAIPIDGGMALSAGNIDG